MLYYSCQKGNLLIGRRFRSHPIARVRLAFFILVMEKVLSIFVDESGDTGYRGDTSTYYLVSFVFHNQQDDISSQLDKVKNELPFHAGPIIRKEKPYDKMDVRDRAKLLRKILVWSTILPTKTKSFIYAKRNVDFDYRKLLLRLARDIFNFLEKERVYFMSFDKIIVYYDRGQKVVEKALLKSFGAFGLNIEFKYDVKPEKYRLLQLTDFVCTLKLIETKMNSHELSHSEAIFFNDPISFKKYFLKALKKKEFK